MTDFILGSSNVLMVTQVAAAETLTNPELQRFLAPFMARDCTVGQAALELGLSANSLLYQVRRLEKLGLLQVVRHEPRAGRAMKIYRSVADAFFVPFRVTKAETIEALLTGMDSDWQRLYLKNLALALGGVGSEVGVRIWRGETGEIYNKPALDQDTLLEYANPALPPMFVLRAAALFLDSLDARELQQDLMALYEKYASKGGKQRHMIHLAFVPFLAEN
jgi:hypothetical protein